MLVVVGEKNIDTSFFLLRADFLCIRANIFPLLVNIGEEEQHFLDLFDVGSEADCSIRISDQVEKDIRSATWENSTPKPISPRR